MPKQTVWLKFNKRVDRRSPRNEGDPDSPIRCENLIRRDNLLETVTGTSKAANTVLDSEPTWMSKYYSIESGVESDKLFTYTKGGKLWLLNERDDVIVQVSSNKVFNTSAYPRSASFKTANQTKLYMVDGKNLWSYDGNAGNDWELISITDTDGNTVNPVDVIEHRDRLWLLSDTTVFVSANLNPETFDSSTDSVNIIVGSGKGRNIGFGKIENNLYIFNTEGIFVVTGDVISALAPTFEVELVDPHKCIARGSIQTVEGAIVYLGEDLELWSWDGVQPKMLSYSEHLALDINPYKQQLEKCSSIYDPVNKMYKISVVATSKSLPNLEFWWDAYEDKIYFIKGRKVTCYARSDATEDLQTLYLGCSDNYIRYEDKSATFDGTPIPVSFRSRNITLVKGTNVRICNFYPQVGVYGDVDLNIRHHLDSRLSDDSSDGTNFNQNLRGEVKTLGSIRIPRQTEFTGRAQPIIDYARGETISFEIVNSTQDLRIKLIAMGVEYIRKSKKKGRIIGQ